MGNITNHCVSENIFNPKYKDANKEKQAQKTPEDVVKSKFLYVRHSLSTANVRLKEIGMMYMNEEDLLDAPLTQKGIDMCLESEAKPILESLDIDTVIVSPLRRCQQTAYHLLKDHPNFYNMLFVLYPRCREHLHTISDVPRPLAETEATARELFMNVDTTTHFKNYSNKDHWFIEDQQSSTKQILLDQLEKDRLEDPEAKVHKSVMKVQLSQFSRCIEEMDNKFERADRFKKFLRQMR